MTYNQGRVDALNRLKAWIKERKVQYTNSDWPEDTSEDVKIAADMVVNYITNSIFDHIDEMIGDTVGDIEPTSAPDDKLEQLKQWFNESTDRLLETDAPEALEDHDVEVARATADRIRKHLNRKVDELNGVDPLQALLENLVNG